MYDQIEVLCYDGGSASPAVAELLAGTEYTVTRVWTVEALVSNITAETFAVVLDHTGGDTTIPVESLADQLPPWCPIICIGDDAAATESTERDDLIVLSTTETDLAERIDAAIRESTYKAAFHQLYWLHSQLQTLTETLSPAALVESEEYARLQDSLVSVSTGIPELLAGADIDHLTAVLEAATIRKQYLDDPERKTEGPRTRSGGKHVPEKCRRCATSWESNSPVGPPGGFVPLGAHIWQCVQCRGIYRSQGRRDGQFRSV